ncbi:MAG: hypothetical protein ACT4P1_10815 [Sporichthyaceae bacterium]
MMAPQALVRSALGLAFVGGLTACGAGAPSAAPPASSTPDGGLVVQLASYDLVANRDQRVIFGLLTGGETSLLVSFGTADVSWTYLGAGAPQPGPAGEARWFPVPGQSLASVPDQARVVRPSEGVGVYALPKVRFEQAGPWRATLRVDVAGTPRSASVDFTVNERPAVIAPGDKAPRTDNFVVGDVIDPPRALDSRADDDGAVPDETLHRMTVADAVTSGKPTMIVVSTPTFCVSQFCGPITDTVENLAADLGDRMNFIHLEVWRDYADANVNKAAADWIYPTRAGELTEPWVFLVDAEGIVAERWDNVVDEVELRQVAMQISAD